MLNKAYAPQCGSVQKHCENASELQRRHLTLLALALGSFCIGTSEFATMGIIQLFAGALRVSIPAATDAITAYAIGVTLGAPAITILAARLNRRTLLLGLMALFVFGNALSAVAGNLDMFVLARFVAGLPQGAYFGAAAVVASYIVGAGRGGKAFALVMTGLTVATIVGSPLATLLGQQIGWRETYCAVSALGVSGCVALWAWLPRTEKLDGGAVMQELSSLWRLSVWIVMLVAALGVSTIFAVYTFIGPLITNLAHASPGWIPIALALFGIGMTVGNLIGGKLADTYPERGLATGFGSALVVLAILGIGGDIFWILLPALFLVGMTMMIAIPTIQVSLTNAAPQAPSLMGAMNLAALNVANALGAWTGGVAIALGYGLLSPVWAGFLLTLLGLAVALGAGLNPRPVAANQHEF